MKLYIKRWYGPNYTIGKLYIDGIYFCDTLEDPNRDQNKNGVFDNNEIKISGDTCIPVGTYNVVLTLSPKFKRMLPRLENVNNFTGVLIHAGNTKKDTEGCILIGINSEIGKVTNSKYYEKLLVEKLNEAKNRNESINIKIE